MIEKIYTIYFNKDKFLKIYKCNILSYDLFLMHIIIMYSDPGKFIFNF